MSAPQDRPLDAAIRAYVLNTEGRIEETKAIIEYETRERMDGWKAALRAALANDLETGRVIVHAIRSGPLDDVRTAGRVLAALRRHFDVED